MKKVLEFVDRLDVDQTRQLHALYQGEWWTRGRTLEEVRRMLTNDHPIFAYADAGSGRLAAFARVLTDGVFKAILFDVIVAEDFRRTGLGKRLMDRVLTDPRLAQVRHIELYCLPELVSFYERYGFASDVGGVLLMRTDYSL